MKTSKNVQQATDCAFDYARKRGEKVRILGPCTQNPGFMAEIAGENRKYVMMILLHRDMAVLELRIYADIWGIPEHCRAIVRQWCEKTNLELPFGGIYLDESFGSVYISCSCMADRAEENLLNKMETICTRSLEEILKDLAEKHRARNEKGGISCDHS